ncbi:hypothetical protein RX799_04080 [Klebsiella oxytoca]|uniref:hypothetical protein n=1 Tax=Klebsiella oxytoca TaxID=571 RepID=UPI003850CAAA
MRTIQLTFCSFFVFALTCLPLISNAATTPGIFPGNGFSTDPGTGGSITALNTTVNLRQISVSCASINAAGALGSQVYAVPCADEHLPALRPTCTVDGLPYSPGMNVSGMIINIYHQDRNSSVSGTKYDVLTGSRPVDSNREGLYLGVSAVLTEKVLADEGQAFVRNIECTYAGTAGVPVYDRIITISPRAPLVFKFWFVDRVSTQVSVTQPPYITGRLGGEFSSPFTLNATNVDFGSVDLHLTWDVSAPCNDWSPTLLLPDGSALAAGHIDQGRLTSNINALTARFTPTALGVFSCTGTLNVSQD